MTKSSRLSRKQVLILAAVTAAGLALRLWHIGFQSLWRDEVDAIRFATQPMSGLVRMFLTPGENGPLYFFALRGWLALFGEGDVALRVFSAIPGAALIPLMFWLGAKLFGKRAGWIAAVLAAVAPYAVWYGQEGKMYAWLALLAAGSFACLWLGLRDGRRWGWVGYVLLTTASLFVHYLSALLIPTYALVFLVGLRRWRGQAKGYLLSLALVTLPYLPFAAWQLPVWLSRFRTGHPFVPFHRALASVLFGFGEGVRPADTFWALVPFLLCLLAAWGLTADSERRASVLACTIWWAAPFVLLFIVSLRTPLFVERYLITTLPAFLLLLAAGLGSLLRRARWLGAVTAAAVLLVSLRGVWVQATQPVKPDVRAAAEHLCPQISPDDGVVFLIPHVEPVFARYCSAPFEGIAAPFTNDGRDGAAVRRELEAALQGTDAVWLVESEAYLWDERGLVRAALEADWEQGEDAEFHLVRVTGYGR